MEVRVRVPTSLRPLADGQAVVVLDAPGEVTTVGAVLDALALVHPELERRVRDERGNTRTHVNLFVGADDVRTKDGQSTEMAAGSELSIIAAISGG